MFRVDILLSFVIFIETINGIKILADGHKMHKKDIEYIDFEFIRSEEVKQSK